jgi:hypothetical protein
VVQREAGVHWDAFAAGLLHPRSTPDVDDGLVTTAQRRDNATIDREDPIRLPMATSSSCGEVRPDAAMTAHVSRGRAAAYVCIPAAGWRCLAVGLLAQGEPPALRRAG